MDWDAAKAHLQYVKQRCMERFGSNSMFDAPLADWRVERVSKLRDVPIHELMVDDQIDREILVTQRTRSDLQHVAWYAKRAAAARADGDEWAYWRSLFWDSPDGVRMTPDEMAALCDWRRRRERERQAHAPKAQGNMADKALVQPPFEAIVAEYAERFGAKTDGVCGVARMRRRCAYLGDLMLRAIESGDELPTIDVMTFMFNQPAASDVEPTVEDLATYWRGLDSPKVQP